MTPLHLRHPDSIFVQCRGIGILRSPGCLLTGCTIGDKLAGHLPLPARTQTFLDLILKDWERDYFNIISLTQAVYILFSSKKLRVCSHLRILTHPSCVSDSHVPEKVDWRELFNTQNMKPSEEYRSEVARAI